MKTAKPRAGVTNEPAGGGEPKDPRRQRLRLNFHPQIIDSLGIHMYQSPLAAIAELIANAWDADAAEVRVTLPTDTDGHAEIVIEDDGAGMTFADCQDRYLTVGRNRRLADGERSPGGRPFLGRKGIGKFAAFGIAGIIEIKTVSATTGERTVFVLDLEKLRSGDLISNHAAEVEVVAADGPEEARCRSHGTRITLRALTIGRRLALRSFARSLARRFVLARQASPFCVTVNGMALPERLDPLGNPIEFTFPAAYREDERPDEVTITPDGWAHETLPGGDEVQWQVQFTQDPIDREELRGVSVYCGIRLAQAPFFFLLSDASVGHHGRQYLTGRVRADYLDRMAPDIITTERQRIIWEDKTTHRFLAWGQTRLQELLGLWQRRRAEAKLFTIEGSLPNFSPRIARLKSSEAKIVKRALLRIAEIAAIDRPQFEELADTLLTAWEGGRLRSIIEEVALLETMDAGDLVNMLSEYQVLTALHVAEAVRAKLDIVDGLRRRIAERDFENAVRDYIAANPWLVSPRWETFQVERRIGKLVADALGRSGISTEPDWSGRIDLALSSGDQLLILEFMRPGVTVDEDHIWRFARYVDTLHSHVTANTGLGFREVSGLLVADKLHRRTESERALKRIAADGMHCHEWEVLLAQAEAQWRDFLFVLEARTPKDDRIKSLLDGSPRNTPTGKFT